MWSTTNLDSRLRGNDGGSCDNARLLASGTVLFAIEVPANFERALRRGDRPALLVAADATDPVAGTLTFLDNSVQNQTGQLNLRATVPNSDRRFWPGRFVNIRLVLNTIRGAVLVPATAPQMSAKGSYVYVVKQDMTVDQRQITLGQRQGDQVVIEQGVQPGERVVTNGQVGVTPGGKVRIEEPKQAGATNAGK